LHNIIQHLLTLLTPVWAEKLTTYAHFQVPETSMVSRPKCWHRPQNHGLGLSRVHSVLALWTPENF